MVSSNVSKYFSNDKENWLRISGRVGIGGSVLGVRETEVPHEGEGNNVHQAEQWRR